MYATATHQFIGSIRRTQRTHRSIEEVRVASDLAQLHNHVHEPSLALLLSGQAVDSIDILLENGTVPLALHVRQADVDVDLLLCNRQTHVKTAQRGNRKGTHLTRDSSLPRS